MKIIISGGGTGGHIFPAIAIANSIKSMRPDADILFVGANGRMEMEKVPQAGYPIKGLNVAGFQRSFSFNSIIKNLQFPFRLIDSMWQARKIVKSFQPDVVVGVGGYASGPVMRAAQALQIPTIIQEQNSYAGVTNKILARRAKKVCVAYDDMGRYFPAEKITYTGNPVRKDILEAELVRFPALMHYKFSPEKKTILVIGGSLGARTINESIEAGLEKIKNAGYQLIWQTGKNFDPYKAKAYNAQYPQFNIQSFIKEMHWAYAAADVVISRAGALSISELCLVGKASVLVPSPNVAEDHQTKNAMALVRKGAALLVTDAEAKEKLVETALSLLNDAPRCEELKNNIRKLGKPGAATEIAQEVLKLAIK